MNADKPSRPVDDRLENELIREVDEELQREKLAQLWRRYGTAVTGLAILIVAATAGWVGWQKWQERERERDALALAQAQSLLARGDAAAAAPAFAAVAREAAPGFAAVATLREAEALIERGDRQAAVDVLNRLAADTGADPLLRDLAVLHAATVGIDTVPPAELAARLEPLTAAVAPWRHNARELLALVRLRAGDEAAAGRLLAELASDPTAPATLRARAEELRQSLGAAAAGS